VRVFLGIDDTDSHGGGCTTYVAYVLAKEVLKRWGPQAFLDFPRLVRLNPNIPFKTRGNAAVALALDVPDPDELWRLAVEVVTALARREGKTDPGIAMAVGEVPERAKTLYRIALTQVVSLNAAERAGAVTWGGRGKIGAVAAIGADLRESTLELLAYREGDRAEIPPHVVKAMETLTYPFTFHNLDRRRVLIQPRGPDPVYYGIRGLTPHHLLYAKALLEGQGYRPAGWAIFRTNQATDAHLRHGVIYDEPHPYSYYTARGIITETRRTKARHVVGRLDTGLPFAAYRHLGPLATALEKCVRCYVELYGGLKPRRGSLYLYVERAHIHGRYVKIRQRCPHCGGALESLGRGKGWKCRKCGTIYHAVETRWVLDVTPSQYILPRPGERRHLLKPPTLDTTLPSHYTPQNIQWIE